MNRLIPLVVVCSLLIVCLLAAFAHTPAAQAATISSKQIATTHASTNSFCSGGVIVEGQPTGYPYITTVCLPVLTINYSFLSIEYICNQTALATATVFSQGALIETVLPGRCINTFIGASSVNVI